VEYRRRKRLRAKKARWWARQAERAIRSAGAPVKEIVTVSKTAAKKLEREETRRRDRDHRKAEHKLSFFDRLFGLGRGPAHLRAKWLDLLLGP